MKRLVAEHSMDRTMLIVAHRTSTLKDADRVVVFDQGQLVEQGGFQELAEDPASRFGTMVAIQSPDLAAIGDRVGISHGLHG